LRKGNVIRAVSAEGEELLGQEDQALEQIAPFRLAPYFRTRIWGFQDLRPWYDYTTKGEPIGEVWLTGDDCVVATGPLTGMSFKEFTARYSAPLLGANRSGQEFPLLIKVLFPKEKLSVQVHPDDKLAQSFGEPRGKTECWYALDAEPDATVALGLKDGVAPEQVRKAIADATLENLLEWLHVNKGDMIFVDAGTVHAIAPGSVLLEVQQNSDLTYRIYDYGRPRELHLEKSFAAMRVKTNAGKVQPIVKSDRSVLIDENYFRVEQLCVQGQRTAEEIKGLEDPSSASFQLFFASRGDVQFSGQGFEAFPLPQGSLAVVPANSPAWSVEAEAKSSLIRIIPKEPKS
jgi:mannose-6-phosphate isomerase